MKSKYFHETKIKELEFQRNRRKSKYDKYFTASLSLLSVFTLFFMFELQKTKKDWGLFILLGLSIIILVIAIAHMQLEEYPEDKEIQREFNVLLREERKRKQGNKQHKQKI